MTGSKPPWALVKPPPDSFFRAISSHPERGSIDPARALRQHHEYQETLSSLVEELVVLPKNELHPDSCFTQDTALVFGPVGLMARSGIGIRKAEVPAVKKALANLVEEVDEIPPPGTLEGGDVVRIGRTLVVGRSRRTSNLGIESLRRFVEPLGYRVEIVDVPSRLVHLSTGLTVISDRLVMGLPELLRLGPFGGLEQIVVTDGPLEACNVLMVGDHAIAAGDHDVHGALERKGYVLHRLNLSEFVKADAGPTCLALIPL